MNQEETLKLWKQGKEAWNAWAEDMLEERKALEDRGEWDVTVFPFGVEIPANEITEQWFTDARAVFSSKETPHTFPEATSFEGWLFPSVSEWSAATFEGLARFDNTTFKGSAQFSNVTFESNAQFDNTTFEGFAQFKSATFKGDADFDDATVKGSAQFDNAAVRGSAQFNNVTFEGTAQFENVTFEDFAQFDETTFEEDTHFNKATFKSFAQFDKVTFESFGRFNNASFEGNTQFNNVTFEGFAGFEDATFKGDAQFNNATFASSAGFEDATFESDAQFNSVCFEKPTRFSGAQFNANTSFNSAQIKQAFDLSGARFKEVPDFRQTHCEEAPLLDDVHINSTSTKQRKSSHEPDFTVTANYRALKRLAIQGHDHKHEVQFFAEELRAQRIMVHKRFGWDWWLSTLFAATSDYGRSILRPIAWWIPVMLISALSYLLTALPAKAPSGWVDAIFQSVVSWYHGIQLALPTRLHISWLPEATEFQQTMCKGGSVVAAAYNLAASKGLIIPGIADRTLIIQAYDCFYDGDVPFAISWIMGIQTLLSAALLFLLLLGIRNRFKLK